MDLPKEFKLEKYFSRPEFSDKTWICSSAVEPLRMKEVLQMADDECKDLWDNLCLEYTWPRGHPALVSEVAKFHNMSVDDTAVFVPQEGIYIAMRCLVSYLSRSHVKSFHAIVTNPAYQSLQENLRSYNCDLDYWTVKDSGEEWTFDLDELKAMVKPETKLLVVNFPHNPSGFIPSPNMWHEIIQFCRDRGIFLFSDEIYRWSNNNGTVPLESACVLYENAITLGGMSKTLAMPGLRIGWLCTKNKEVMKMMLTLKDYTTVCPSAPSEILAIIALRNKDKIIERSVDIIKSNLDILDAFSSRHQDVIQWYRPKACTHSLMKLKSWLLRFPGGGASGLCKVLLEEAGLVCASSKMFSEITDEEDVYIRIGFGYKDLPKALTLLEDFIIRHKTMNQMEN